MILKNIKNKWDFKKISILISDDYDSFQENIDYFINNRKKFITISRLDIFSKHYEFSNLSNNFKCVDNTWNDFLYIPRFKNISRYNNTLKNIEFAYDKPRYSTISDMNYKTFNRVLSSYIKEK